ncbi:galactose oxidase [Jiangella asiatica]|uniref:Galactose oxidase n=1 Tax=Jiangella asiatica TaxID=2530372 RepID=A0A4R5CQJ2_9ACTN|nr:galactose oxidase [Jiangella asiatica]TDE02416.1 galactose oxidase [Jiangella asiatica]
MTQLSRRRTLALGAAATGAAWAAGTVPAGATGTTGAAGERGASWTQLADVPPNTTDWHEAVPVGEPYWGQPGLAGPIAGTHGDHLIVAGGANFPEPARTATRTNTLGKVYWTDAFVLRRDGDDHRWLDTDLRLPDAVGYAATVSTDDGMLVIGGEGFRGGPAGTAQRPAEKFADVYYLRWNAGRGTLEREDLPDLPRPMSYAVAGIVDDVVYVAEGADFVALDLDRPDRGWTALPTWPGDPRTVAVGAAQDGRFYVMSGRAQHADKSWTFYRDAYAYEPRRHGWRRVADLPWCVTAGLAHAVGRTGIVVAGGDKDIDRWNLIEHHVALRNAAAPGSEEWNRHNDVVTWIYDHHTGFNVEVLRYDTRRDRWQPDGFFPGPPPATTPAVDWDGDLVVASGEIGPGIRTPRVWKARF